MQPSKRDLKFHIRSLSRFIYYVTDEEDRCIKELHDTLTSLKKKLEVFNRTMGLISSEALIQDWQTRAHVESKVAKEINEALIHIYKEDTRNQQQFYVIQDADSFFEDPMFQRRILNLAHQLRNNNKLVKVVIFLGTKMWIPPNLIRYIEVVTDPGLDIEGVKRELEKVQPKVKLVQTPSLLRAFHGMTTFEIDAAVAQSIVATKKDEHDPKRVDAKTVGEYRQRQLHKTSLLEYVDVSNETFENVGGLDRFKAWATSMKAGWTDEGQKFGLTPPKGVLLLGVWGCGKSISAKALGNAWRLPVVKMEMGKLRNSLVGASEANVYKALRMVESLGSCILWIDEGEKSLSGGASSNQSDSGTTSRVLGIFSTWIQENKNPVCLAITANSLKSMPVEFVRRVDERFFFDIPSAEERVEVLRIHLKKAQQDTTRFNLASLAEDCSNMVSSEIEQAIKAAMLDSFNASKESLDEDILSATFKKRPRIIKAMGDELKEVTDWVGYDPEADEGIRAKLASSRKTAPRMKVT